MRGGGQRRALAIATAAVSALALAAGARSAAPLAGFRLIDPGPRGGAIWEGSIPVAAAASTGRPSEVYLPPRFTRARRYPVVYLLHGMPGSPYSYVDGLELARTADELIAAGRLRPFIAVIPVAGPSGRYDGEWAGPWEDMLVRDVVPWADAHLPTEPGPAGRVLAGLSAGAFGAIDIGLRHPGLFGTLESWSGYFHPFRDGPLARASAAELAAHDPVRLVRAEAARLRRLGVRFFLASGPSHGHVHERQTPAFARELASLGLVERLVLLTAHPAGGLWRAQLRDGLLYALGR